MKTTTEFLIQTATSAAVMNVSQQIEIRLTHRSGSDEPVRILERLSHHSAPRGAARVALGQAVQALLAASAVLTARVLHRVPTVIAIVVDALIMVILNAGIARALHMGDMPWAWPRQELAVDLTHKTSLATAAVLVTRRRH